MSDRAVHFTGMPSASDLESIWARVRRDYDARKALATLEKKGFAISHVAVDVDTWPGIIAGIPFLENISAKSRSIRVPKGATRAVSLFLREVANGVDAKYSEVEAMDEKGAIYTKLGIVREFPDFRLIADAIGKISRSRWTVTDHNPQQNAIAFLRWEIKHRTGKACDTELVYLLRAVFKAAGKKFPMNSVLLVAKDAIRKAMDHEKATRAAGRRKLRKPTK